MANLQNKYVWLLLALVAVIVTAVVVALTVSGGGDGDGAPSAAVSENPVDDPAFVEIGAPEGSIGLYEKFEALITLDTKYDNPFDPDEVDLSAVFTSPDGAEWAINGFFDGVNFKLRFAPDTVGTWTYRFVLKDARGDMHSDVRAFAAVDSQHPGWLRVSEANPRFLSHADGSGFYGVGVAYPWNIRPSGLDKIAAAGGSLITYWNGNYDNAGSGGGSNQLESVSSGIGRYDVLKGFRIDELVDMFEERDLYMNFVIWPHDSLAQYIDWPKAWDKNAYSLLGEAKEFYGSEDMWAYQEKLYRYIIARWGHSRAIGIWDLICEINGTDGWMIGREAEANAWVDKIHDYFKANDPYGRPTKGSMAGGHNDFWDAGYRTLDIADRENYFDLHYSAYAADVQNRWQHYEKPLLIGETGNVADVGLYHNAIWVTLANGLAASPIWWDIDKVNDEMFEQMRHFSAFVEGLDVLERRTPVVMNTRSVDVRLAPERALMDGVIGAGWSLPDWADANKDGQGGVYAASMEGDAVVALMRFATGGFSQGVVQRMVDNPDWAGMERLTVDIMAEYSAAEGALLARPVLFPGGEWTEGDNMSDVALVPGEWTTLSVPLADAPDGYWRDGKRIAADDLARIAGWGVKVYTTSSVDGAQPATIRLRQAKLSADGDAPVIQRPENEGWLMVGERTSYGWIVTELDGLGGKSAAFAGLPDGMARVEWYDTWTGSAVDESEQQVSGGELTLTIPETGRKDIALRLWHE